MIFLDAIPDSNAPSAAALMMLPIPMNKRKRNMTARKIRELFLYFAGWIFFLYLIMRKVRAKSAMRTRMFFSI